MHTEIYHLIVQFQLLQRVCMTCSNSGNLSQYRIISGILVDNLIRRYHEDDKTPAAATPRPTIILCISKI